MIVGYRLCTLPELTLLCWCLASHTHSITREEEEKTVYCCLVVCFVFAPYRMDEITEFSSLHERPQSQPTRTIRKMCTVFDTSKKLKSSDSLIHPGQAFYQPRSIVNGPLRARACLL